MHINRRDLVKVLPLGVLFPVQILNSLANEASTNLKSNPIKKNIDKVYDEAIVVDGIVITRNWSI